jgi:hypothetical protein
VDNGGILAAVAAPPHLMPMGQDFAFAIGVCRRFASRFLHKDKDGSMAETI